MNDVGVLLYVGECFEESARRAVRIADRLLLKDTRVIILEEGDDPHAAATFAEIAERTDGAVLSFDLTTLDRISGIFQAVSVLAAGGVEAVARKQQELPAASLLLQQLDPKRLLLTRR